MNSLAATAYNGSITFTASTKSHEWLDQLIRRVADWPVLVLAMFRPEFQPPWIGQPHVMLVALPRLDRNTLQRWSQVSLAI